MKSLLNNLNPVRATVTISAKVLVLMAVFSADAKITLAPQFANDMVLQRDTPNILQGYADQSESISLYLDEKKLQSTEVKQGAWQLTLPAHLAGGPHTLKIQTSTQLIELQNVLFGDVWLASGQSNMEYTLGTSGSNYSTEILSANLPHIRQFRVERNAAYHGPLSAVAKGQWTIAQGQDLSKFSAVGYFFTKHVHAHTGIPIGIINNAYAGSRIQAWLSESALSAYPKEVNLLQRNKKTREIEKLQTSDKNRYQSWQQELAAKDLGLRHNWFAEHLNDSQWPLVSVPGYWTNQGQEAFSGSMWFRTTFLVSAEQATQASSLKLGRIVDQDQVYINGQRVGDTQYQYPQRIYSLDSGVLKIGLNQISVRIVSHHTGHAGFVPAKPYQLTFKDSLISLSGLWRYQVGHRMAKAMPSPEFKTNEQPSVFYNAMLAPLAKTQLKGVLWYQGESNAKDPNVYQKLFPDMISQWRALFSQPTLPFLYVQLANYLQARHDPSIAGWADIRAAQAQGLTVSNTAMVTAIDLGEWNDIHPQNKASVGQRLANAALQKVYNKPSFSYQGPELTCAERVDKHQIKIHSKFSPLAINGPDAKVQGFAISADNANYRWVEGELHPTFIILKVKEANKFVSVSYAWQSNPTRANLSNNQGLPAYPAKLVINDHCEMVAK
ncbi:MAG: sialate O-acetylesterase [Paraglaciecola sp.]|uniref:sialate O-acetylesterase n=1 Tax=Paraglaciecola sp. TaxID=1920173 RepID=UPI003299F209